MKLNMNLTSRIILFVLEEGWKVKHISACALGDGVFSGQAYIVIEKDVE